MAPWLDAQYQDFGSKVADFAKTDPNQYVAGVAPLQQQAFDNAQNLGGWTDLLGQSTALAKAAGTAAPNTTGPAALATASGYNPAAAAPAAKAQAQGYAAQTYQAALAQAAQYAAQQAIAKGYTANNATSQGYDAKQATAQGYGAQNVGFNGYTAQGYNPTTAGPAQIGAMQNANASTILGMDRSKYTNPYLNDVVNTTLSDFDQNAGRTQAQLAAQGALNKAFGGSRFALKEAQTTSDLARARAASEAGLRDQAYNQATGAMQFDAGQTQQVGLANALAQNNRTLQQGSFDQQSGLANQDALNTAGQFNAGASNAANQFNAGASNTALLANQNAQNTAAQFGADAQNKLSLFNTGAQNDANQFTANASNATALANALAQNQAAQFGAAADNQASLFNTGAANDAAQFNANALTTTSLANIAAMNEAAKVNTMAQIDANAANAGAENQVGIFNAGQANQLALANQAAANQAAQFNVGALNQAGQFNAGALNQNAQFNAGQEDTALARALQAAGLLGTAANSTADNTRTDLATLLSLGDSQRQIQQQQDSALPMWLQTVGSLNGQIPINAYTGQTAQINGTTNTNETKKTSDPMSAIGTIGALALAPFSGGTSLLAALGGMGGLGAGLAGAAGGAAAAGAVPTAASLGIFSDIRLKRDIETVGYDPKGRRVVDFKYIWSPQVYRGHIAQELLATDPHAVHMDDSGFLKVNYGALV